MSWLKARRTLVNRFKQIHIIFVLMSTQEKNKHHLPRELPCSFKIRQRIPSKISYEMTTHVRFSIYTF